MVDKLPLEDASGNKYDFWLYPIGTNFKKAAGVYAFARDDGNAWAIIYIGEAEDLKDRLYTRLKQHHRYKCAVQDESATHLLTRLVAGGEQARLDLETSLRRHYDPVCNRQ